MTIRVCPPQRTTRRSPSIPMKLSPGSRWSTKAGGGATAPTATLECSRPTTWSWSSLRHRTSSPPGHIDPTIPGHHNVGGETPAHSARSSSSSSSELLSLDQNTQCKVLSYHRPVSSPTLGSSSLSFPSKRFHDVVMFILRQMNSLATCKDLQVEQTPPPLPNVVTRKCDAVYQSQLKLIFCEH